MSLTRDEAIRRLQTVESEIRRLGVRRLALFGSVLRNEARPDSNVDVLVEFAPTEKTFDRFMALEEKRDRFISERGRDKSPLRRATTSGRPYRGTSAHGGRRAMRPYTPDECVVTTVSAVQ